MLNFSLSRLPAIEFGSGSTEKLPVLLRNYGQNILLVRGSERIEQTPKWQALLQTLKQEGYRLNIVGITQEPSPELIDDLCVQCRRYAVDVVLGIGGGSVLDAAKAIAGLLALNNSVMDFLEGVGPELEYPGPSIPFVAVPTTAGTGSEATKNAVLSRQGPDGFKKSFRHEKLLAQLTVLDPQWLSSCPPALIAANGMDALTQLIESYVSLKANHFTDMLAESGIRMVKRSLMRWYQHGESAQSEQADMAYAALLSGITLAQVGLGSVHGLASPLGAYYPIAHGEVCGCLLAAATELNIEVMQAREPDNIALQKYKRVAEFICGRHFREADEAYALLLRRLQQWRTDMEIPSLSRLGVPEQDFDKIVANSRGSSMKTNPVVLRDEEIMTLLQRCL